MTQYEQQAADFLKKCNVQMTAKFSGHKKHFADDTQLRDVFRVALKSSNHVFRFNFGQSINNSDGNGSNPPTPYDVLSCIEKYPVYDFEYFCSNYGYDTNSRKAYKTYKAVKKEWENVNLLFTSEQIEELRDIQ